jgi:hypothetical protein
VKPGDLVRCTYQPIVKEGHLGYTEPMDRVLINHFGFLSSKKDKNYWFVYFPHMNYVHLLATDQFEVISECG